MKFTVVTDRPIRSSNSIVEDTLTAVFKSEFSGASKIKNRFTDSWSLEGSIVVPIKSGTDTLTYTVDAAGRQAHFILQSSEYGRMEFDAIVAREDSAKLVSTIKSKYIKMGYKEVNSSRRIRASLQENIPIDTFTIAVGTVACAFDLLHWIKFLHWSTTGLDFLPTHEALDEYYEKINEDLDTLGEIVQRLNSNNTTMPTGAFQFREIESVDAVLDSGRTWVILTTQVDVFLTQLEELYQALPDEFHDIASELDSIIYYWYQIQDYKNKQLEVEVL